jgi:hypothetical protein
MKIVDKKPYFVFRKFNCENRAVYGTTGTAVPLFVYRDFR